MEDILLKRKKEISSLSMTLNLTKLGDASSFYNAKYLGGELHPSKLLTHKRNWKQATKIALTLEKAYKDGYNDARDMYDPNPYRKMNVKNTIKISFKKVI